MTIMSRLAAAVLLAAVAVQPVIAAEGTPNPPRQKWTFSGIFGKYDRAQLQRGFKVYREVCQACHHLNIPFRNLSEPGGPQFSVAQVAALAAEYKVQDGPNDAGDMFERPARAADKMPWTFPNKNAAAAANGGKAPPDMQLIAKARGFERGFPWWIIDTLPGFVYQEHGPDYIHALMVGYKEAPKGFELPAGGHYNEYFPGHVIAMPKPIQDGQVDYPKGPDGKAPVPETLDQYGKDLGAFLMWTAEPKLEERKRIGFMVMIFLAIFAFGMYRAKKIVWKKVKEEAHA